jgi:hypothetical protein
VRRLRTRHAQLRADSAKDTVGRARWGLAREPSCRP